MAQETSSNTVINEMSPVTTGKSVYPSEQQQSEFLVLF